LTTLTDELNRAFTELTRTKATSAETGWAQSPNSSRGQRESGKSSEQKSADNSPVPPYFISYSISDSTDVTIRAVFGGLIDSETNHTRMGDVVVRIGDPTLDNTHGTHHSGAATGVQIPLGDDSRAISRSMWEVTNAAYGNALETYLRVKTEAQVRAKEEDTSADFSKEKPEVSIAEPAAPPKVDNAAWEKRVSALSAVFREFPDVTTNVVIFTDSTETDYFVSTEGSRIVQPHRQARLVVFAITRAEDGMDLFRAQTFEADTADSLPSQSAMKASLRELGKSLEALRKAPVTEPFNGPAILSGRAAAVFFHEVLGHRLEGQRQRGDDEGQTFTKELNKDVLPSFLSVADDPTQQKFGTTQLSGFYQYDEEGQKARRVDLIQDGVLKTFLMSRLPIASFSTSNGHGRAQTGRMPTGRQGNLIVTSTKTVSDAELRKQLIAEAKKQGKPYGLFFEDISSGFAVTQRNSPQAFQVIPLVVWRVYVDGRPDELVRGVSIVGTPLAAMKSILMTSDTSEVFNGECGAESGSIPVSAVAPSMLLSGIETQRQPQGTSRPPILPIPSAKEAR
jgi:predicted Zn-dependent protease